MHAKYEISDLGISLTKFANTGTHARTPGTSLGPRRRRRRDQIKAYG